MRFFNIASLGVLFLFVCAGQPETSNTQFKIGGAVYRSVFLGEGIRGEDVRVELTSAVFTKGAGKIGGTDAPKVYLYSYLVENTGEKNIKLEFLNLSDDPSFPSVRELEPKKGVLFSLQSKAKPKLMPISQVVMVSEEGRWTAEGLGLFLIYVPDVPIRPPDNKNRASSKNTARQP